MTTYQWTGNPWYDLNGQYYANAEDAERQRKLQRERAERDAVRLAASVEGTDGMGMPVWCVDCTVPLTDEEADCGSVCALCAARHIVAA
jgi:hypothetical protein